MSREMKQYLEVYGDKVIVNSKAPEKIKQEYQKTFSENNDIFDLIDYILQEELVKDNNKS